MTVSLRHSVAQNLLDAPESVTYDQTTRHYYVTNAGNGAIIRVDENGNHQTIRDAPATNGSCRGIHLLNDKLYAACNAGVVEIDLATGTPSSVIPIPGQGFINDITADVNGMLYVGDGGANADVVYQVNPADQTFVNYATINGPNGLYYDEADNRLLVTTSGQIHSISLDDASVTPVVNTGHQALDGLTRDLDGNLYFSSWLSEGVYRFDPDFNVPAQLVQGNYDGPADIFFNMATNELVVPVFNENRLDILVVTPPPAVSLDTPADGTTDVPATAQLFWLASPSADQYHLQVSTVSDFSTTVFDNETLTDLTASVGSLVGETVHYWHVSGINAMGTGDWSPTWSFTTGQPNQAPTVVAPLGDLELMIGSGDFTVDLTPVFNDRDGDALSYSATSTDDNVATASVSDATLTVSPISVGTVAITVTAEDPYGASVNDMFEVTVPSGIFNEQDGEIPAVYSLDNYPNPFNPSTTIVYTAPQSGHIEITIHDLTGRLVTTLVSSEHAAGRYEVEWDAQQRASGLYLYILNTPSHRIVRTLMLTK